jgi:8-oxo-dGTP diphosphatase
MFEMAVRKIKKRLLSSTIAQYLLSLGFTLTQLENLYEDVLGIGIDKRNFRKKILKSRIVTPTGGTRSGLKHRPALLYKFTEDRLVEESII